MRFLQNSFQTLHECSLGLKGVLIKVKGQRRHQKTLYNQDSRLHTDIIKHVWWLWTNMWSDTSRSSWFIKQCSRSFTLWHRKLSPCGGNTWRKKNVSADAWRSIDPVRPLWSLRSRCRIDPKRKSSVFSKIMQREWHVNEIWRRSSSQLEPLPNCHLLQNNFISIGKVKYVSFYLNSPHHRTLQDGNTETINTSRKNIFFFLAINV